MLKDMSIPYPAEAHTRGPKVIGLADNIDYLSASQVMILEALIAESTMFSKHGRVASASFYALLNFGWHIFATDDEEYPFVVARKKDVDEIENEWDVEDMGDGLSVHRIKQQFQHDSMMYSGSTTRNANQPANDPI